MKLEYEDYCRLPQDGKMHEIINGLHYNHPAPIPNHQIVSRNLERVFESFVRKKKLGLWLSAPVDVLIGRFDIVQPDKVFLSTKNRKLVTASNIKGSPDLVVEIVSSRDPDYDAKTKLKLYERYKVRYYLLVDPLEYTVTVYVLCRRKYRRAGTYGRGERFSVPLFKGLKIDVDAVFEEA